MKNKFLVLFACFLTALCASANCNDSYSTASYALNHAKKSFNAKNFDHQQYYANKALEALEKAKKFVEICGCDKALDPIRDGIENLEKAMDQEDWDMGRYYTKKAVENAKSLINELDIFTQDQTEEVVGSDILSDDPSAEEKALLTELAQLKKRQLELAHEQKKLLERQQVLERKISKLGS